MSINQKIVSWAKSQFNKRVGDGECWTYVEQAITKAGGNSSKSYTNNFGANSDYVWGTKVLANPLAGDVIQFRNYSWNRNSEVKIIYKDGSSQTEPTGGFDARVHHSAIIEQVLTDGTVVVLEQNVPQGKGVIRSTLRLKTAKKPKVSKQEFRQHPDTNKREMATVETTIDEQVKGNVWIYRPQK